ncbi:DUF4810 domain-containing protein [Saccharicrinis fermentans]|uniref:DUF4810 domain-containing protein n=1 Tax=Saccharicrinis fermentans DSM 9555 = JCM 21142 TaxID=869213 RepID=W7Y861_9BACT|nr:DUF4810 domain-containing protein [Saccharicrinis fermentans]GAF03878.1 hypothetical protein JCM21142_72566 [Saccharicrinis fermentans DSM 9555 = JCM 21142]
MKKLIFTCISVLFLASCSVQEPLYNWDKYETNSYNYLKKSDDASTQKLIETYQKMIDKPYGSRKVVPPGIYADYGYVLLQANKTQEGKKMLQKEVEMYPESKVFIDRILKMLE